MSEKYVSRLDLLPGNWPEEINRENFEVVGKQFRLADEITADWLHEGIQRTPTVAAAYMREKLDQGCQIVLTSVDLSRVSTEGSTGTAARLEPLQVAAKKIGAEALFRRLPPIVVDATVTESTGNWRVIDVKTRLHLAAKLGMTSVRGYCIRRSEAE